MAERMLDSALNASTLGSAQYLREGSGAFVPLAMTADRYVHVVSNASNLPQTKSLHPIHDSQNRRRVDMRAHPSRTIVGRTRKEEEIPLPLLTQLTQLFQIQHLA